MDNIYIQILLDENGEKIMYIVRASVIECAAFGVRKASFLNTWYRGKVNYCSSSSS